MPINFNFSKDVQLSALTIFLYAFGWGIVEAFIPIYFKELFGSYAAVGIVTAAFWILSIFWTPVIGFSIDFISKKAALVAALLAFLPFSVIFLALKTVTQFLIFRIYHAAVSSTVWTVTEAYIREHSRKGKTALTLSFYNISWAIPYIFGPVIGGVLLANLGWSIFYSISLFAAASLFPVLFIKERLLKVKVHQISKELAALKFGLALPYAINFLIAVATGLLGMLLPLLLNELGAGFVAIGLGYSLFTLPVLSQPLFARAADATGKAKVVKAALAAAAALFVVLYFTKAIWLILFVGLALGLAFAAAIPVIGGIITESFDRNAIGELTGVARATALAGTALGTLGSGFFADAFGLSSVWLLGGIVCGIGFVVANFLGKKF